MMTFFNKMMEPLIKNDLTFMFIKFMGFNTYVFLILIFFTFWINILSKINLKNSFVWNKVYTPCYFLGILMLMFTKYRFVFVADYLLYIFPGFLFFSIVYYHFFFNIFFYQGDEKDFLTITKYFNIKTNEKYFKYLFDFLFKNKKDIAEGVFILETSKRSGFILITFFFLNVNGWHDDTPFFFNLAFSIFMFIHIFLAEHYYNFYVTVIKKSTVEAFEEYKRKEFEKEEEERKNEIMKEEEEEKMREELGKKKHKRYSKKKKFFIFFFIGILIFLLFLEFFYS